MKTVLRLVLIFSLFVTVANATDGWDLPQLMNRLAEVKTINARFQERKELAMLAEPLLLTGTLSYNAPHYLQKHTLQPYDERYTVDQDWLTIETSEGRRNLYLPGHVEVGALVEAIRATLAGDLATLQRYYRCNCKDNRPIGACAWNPWLNEWPSMSARSFSAARALRCSTSRR
ncbi:MAG: hypothetical protein HC808_09415 [Candidatus Competibacteraceae bacterium]|nr:hypothetical protein [Candidatus Competibacteraceae bacterium]